MAKGYLYAVRMLVPEYQYSPVKIGMTAIPKTRRRHYETSGPFPVEWIAQWKVADARGAEQEAHRRFAAYRLNGEWFYPHPMILDFIKEQSRRKQIAPKLVLVEFADKWEDVKSYAEKGPSIRHTFRKGFDVEGAKKEARKSFWYASLFKRRGITEEDVARILGVPMAKLELWRDQDLIMPCWWVPITYTEHSVERLIETLAGQNKQAA